MENKVRKPWTEMNIEEKLDFLYAEQSFFRAAFRNLISTLNKAKIFKSTLNYFGITS